MKNIYKKEVLYTRAVLFAEARPELGNLLYEEHNSFNISRSYFNISKTSQLLEEKEILKSWK